MIAICRTKVGHQQIQRQNEMALSPPYALTNINEFMPVALAWVPYPTSSCLTIVTDSGGQKLAYVYFEDEPGRRGDYTRAIKTGPRVFAPRRPVFVDA